MPPPVVPKVAGPTPIRPPTTPAAPAPPGQGFTCGSDDAALAKVPSRRADDPAYRKNRILLGAGWFPGSVAPTADNQGIAYVAGKCAFSDMAEALATAFAPNHRIYLLGWSTDKGTMLGSASLEDHLRNTRAQIRAMYYNGKIGVSPALSVSAPINNKWIDDTINSLPNGASLLDGRLPPFGIHHQKLVVVQGQFGIVAFVGGMDIEPSRTKVEPATGLPYHDVTVRITGPAALACRKVFEDRWLDHPSTGALDTKLGAAPTATVADRRATAFPAPAALDPAGLNSGSTPSDSATSRRRVLMSVGRTFGKGVYSFAPNGDYSAWALVEHGIRQARRWIYLEDQYLCSRMARKALLDRMRDPSFEYLLMLMNGSETARADLKFITTARNEFRRDLLAIDPQRKRWGMYTLRTPQAPERQQWCGTYAHSKTWVFDDSYVITGSANCDNRGFTLDSEIVVGVSDNNYFDVALGHSFATDLRTALWHKHLGVDHARLRDWDKGIAFWRSPPPSAMVQDASGYENDNDLTPPSHFPDPAYATQVELAWTTLLDPDAR